MFYKDIGGSQRSRSHLFYCWAVAFLIHCTKPFTLCFLCMYLASAYTCWFFFLSAVNNAHWKQNCLHMKVLLDMLALWSASDKLSRLNFFTLSHGYIWPDVHFYPTDGCTALVTIPLESAQTNELFHGEVHLIPKRIFKPDWINVPHSFPISL